MFYIFERLHIHVTVHIKLINTRTVKWVTNLFKMSLFFFRLLITGPVSHYIYHLLEVLLPNTVPYCLIKRLLLERLIFAPAFLLLFYVVMNALEVMFHSWDESDFLLCCTEIYAFLNTAQQYYLISALCLHLPHFLDNSFVVITVIDMLFYHLLSSMEKLVVSTVRWVES